MSTTQSHDLAVIGSGPAGYVAAIKAAQLGLSVALIEKGPLGGCCLNEGCIPTKTLIASAEALHAVKRASEFGIQTGPVSFHYEKMKERKDAIIQKIRSGLSGLLQSNRITIYQGRASFESPTVLKVLGPQNLLIESPKIIIATGSVPLEIGAFPCDHQRILNSTSLLEITQAPQSLAIIGGGYIGCEFASLFAELGTKVSVFEALPSILSVQGKTIAEFMTRNFQKRGIDVYCNTQVRGLKNQGDCVELQLDGKESLHFDFVLVSVGRKVFTEGLKLENAGLCTTEKGFLSTDAHMQTQVPGIYAIGDVTGRWMLAHVGSHQGLVAASHAAGQEAKMHYEAVPAVVFTHPEIATVGMTLEEAQAKGHTIQSAPFPLQILGKAQASKDLEGFAQIIADKKTGQILGAVVIGHEASNLIAEMALAIQNELTLSCITDTIHAHPTLAEAWPEAAFLAQGTPLHFPPKKPQA